MASCWPKVRVYRPPAERTHCAATGRRSQRRSPTRSSLVWCTDRGQPRARCRAIEVFPEPGAPVRIRTRDESVIARTVPVLRSADHHGQQRLARAPPDRRLYGVSKSVEQRHIGDVLILPRPAVAQGGVLLLDCQHPCDAHHRDSFTDERGLLDGIPVSAPCQSSVRITQSAW